MSKHTPGPWVARNSGPHWNNSKVSNWTVHYGDDEEHIVDHVYEEADARLIAQAPRLLEALGECISAIKQLQYDHGTIEGSMALSLAEEVYAAATKETSHDGQ